MSDDVVMPNRRVERAARIGNRRWSIAGLLGVGVVVNYLDRINLSVAAPDLAARFHLGPGELGLLFGAYAWTYALLQIPSGLILDRLGVALVGRISVLLWAGASGLAAISTGYVQLFGARLLLGIAEAQSFPANAKAVALWFPRRERGLATAIFDASAKFSNVIGVPLVAVVIAGYGWRWGFGVTAILSLAYFAVFLRYRDPMSDPRLGRAEREMIERGGSVRQGRPPQSQRRLLLHLLRRRKIWGATLLFMAYGYSFFLFLTWLPGYLVSTMHVGTLASAGLAAIPWLAATLSDLLIGGWLIDRMIARGVDDSRARKSVLLCGMLTGLAVFGAVLTRQPVLALASITVALAGLSAAAPVIWTIPGLIGPRGGAATVAGIMNFSNTLMAIVAPAVTGGVVAATGSFTPAFAVAGGALVAGILAFIALVGRLEPIREPGTPRTPAAGVSGPTGAA